MIIAKLGLWSNNGRVIRALDPQSMGPEFKTTGQLHGQLSLYFFRS